MTSNLFEGLQRISHPLDITHDENDDPRESPFVGNHVVTTVRNLKRIK